MIRLLSRYRKNHTVYKDHTSPILYDFMWGKNAQSVGTGMSNQLQLPQTVVKKKLNKMNSFSWEENTCFVSSKKTQGMFSHYRTLYYVSTGDIFRFLYSDLIFSFCLVPASYHRLPLCQILCFLVHSWGCCYCYLVFTIYLYFVVTLTLFATTYLVLLLFMANLNVTTCHICYLYYVPYLSTILHLRCTPSIVIDVIPLEINKLSTTHKIKWQTWRPGPRNGVV